MSMAHIRACVLILGTPPRSNLGWEVVERSHVL